MDMNFNWDEVKKQLKESVELEEDKDARKVKIKFKGEIQKEQNQMLDKMISDEQGLRQTLNQFVGKGEEIACDIKFVEAENSIVIENFKDKDTTHEVYEFFNDMFFGDFLKNLIEQMMNAFKGLGDFMK